VQSIHLETWALVCLSALIAQVLGFLGWFNAARVLGANRVSVFANLMPIVGVSVGVMLLNEPFGWLDAVSAVVILAGVYLANSKLSMIHQGQKVGLNMIRVVCTPGVCGGRPRVENTRTTVGYLVVSLKLYNARVDDVVTNLNLVDSSDVYTVLQYCARKQCITDGPDNFCGSCVLDNDNEDEPAAIRIDPSGEIHFNPNASSVQIFGGTAEEEAMMLGPHRIWEFAADLLKDANN
jgi:uncharacterized protein (DUF433 family)